MGFVKRIAREFLRRSIVQMRASEDGQEDYDYEDGDLPMPINLHGGQHQNSARTVYFFGDVTEELVKHTIVHLVTLAEEKPNEPIHLIISTNGGSVVDMLALYDVMKMVTTPIHTVGIGKIMSAGCLLLAAGDKRKMGANATLMYHSIWSGSHGSQWEMKVALAEHERMARQTDGLVAFETGHSVEDIQALYAVERVDRYMTPEEALAFGFIDEIISGTADAT